MDIKDLILNTLKEKGEVRSREIVEKTGFSREYINRFFQELREEGEIILIGRANRARYIRADREILKQEKGGIKRIYRILKNEGLHEDKVLSDIKKNTGIFDGLRENVAAMLEYGFTEMLNNAIEHSSSEKVKVRMEKKDNNVVFEVRDRGVGIFCNIMKKKNLASEMDALQDLLKGKQTTEPASHSGEGIFFTSKAADILTIQSSGKKVVFDNITEDVYLRDAGRKTVGTRVIFSIAFECKKNLNDIFREYADDSFHFSKTEVAVKLYKEGADYVSRSQARRILTGLEKFDTVILDFDGIDTVGQAFADEVYRVWRANNPGKKIVAKNACDNVLFMIRHADSGASDQ